MEPFDAEPLYRGLPLTVRDRLLSLSETSPVFEWGRLRRRAIEFRPNGDRIPEFPGLREGNEHEPVLSQAPLPRHLGATLSKYLRQAGLPRDRLLAA